MAKRKELVERDALGFLIAQGRALVKVPAPTKYETNLSFVLRNITAAKAWPVIAKWITSDSRGALFVKAFSYGYLSGFVDAEAGRKVEAASGSKDAAGKLKGAFPLFVYELARLGVPLKAESVETLWGMVEDAYKGMPESLTPLQGQALGLFKKANERTKRPLVPEVELDETGAEPVIRYRLEGENKRRTCTHHNLKTRVIPAVQKALSHK